MWTSLLQPKLIWKCKRKCYPTKNWLQHLEKQNRLILLSFSQDGDKFWRMPECYIRGSTIKYLRIPDEIIDMVKEEVASKGRGRGGSQQNKQQGKGRGGPGRGKTETTFFLQIKFVWFFKLNPEMIVCQRTQASIFSSLVLYCRCVWRPWQRDVWSWSGTAAAAATAVG